MICDFESLSESQSVATVASKIFKFSLPPKAPLAVPLCTYPLSLLEFLAKMLVSCRHSGHKAHENDNLQSLVLVNALFQEKIPPFPFLGHKAISGGGGWYTLDSLGNSTRPPSLIHPPYLEGYFLRWGVGVYQNLAHPSLSGYNVLNLQAPDYASNWGPASSRVVGIFRCLFRLPLWRLHRECVKCL